jgi:hypothetical protein
MAEAIAITKQRNDEEEGAEDVLNNLSKGKKV